MGEIKADFPSFAISFATAPTALANCPPFPSVIYMLCMAVWEMIALGHYKWADPSPKFWEEKERGGKAATILVNTAIKRQIMDNRLQGPLVYYRNKMPSWHRHNNGYAITLVVSVFKSSIERWQIDSTPSNFKMQVRTKRGKCVQQTRNTEISHIYELECWFSRIGRWIDGSFLEGHFI